MERRQALWAVLRAGALVEGEPPEALASASPWYVRIMLGVAGWIGAFFLLAFAGTAMSFIFTQAAVCIPVGLLCCLGAGLLFLLARDSEFISQFALALGFAGQALVGVGIFSVIDDRGLAFLLFGLFELTTAVLLANYINRVLATWAAVVALALALRGFGFYPLATPLAAAAFAIVWLKEESWAVHGRALRAIGYGLALGLLQLGSTLNHYLLRGLLHWRVETSPLFTQIPRLGTILTVLVVLAVVTVLLRRQELPLFSRTGIALLSLTGLLLTASFWAWGLAVGLLVLIVGYAGGNRILAGLGLLGLAVFLSYYYYHLQTTLLTKSVVLISTGALLLAVQVAMRLWFSPVREEGSAHA